MALEAPSQITAPPVLPLPYGLLSVADVRIGDRPRVLMGSWMLTDNCVVALDAPDYCPPPDPVEPKEVTDGRFVSYGTAFAGYSLLRCRVPGGDMDDNRAGRVMSLAEARMVERGTMRQLLAAAASATTTLAEDITPAAGAVCPELGLALLEGYAARAYGGIPVVHVARSVGSLLGTRGSIIRSGNRLESVQGAWVASGGGYDGPFNLGPAGVAPAAGESWMYVTGALVVERGPIIDSGNVLVQAAATEPPTIGGQYVNEFDRMVERAYGVTADCMKAAIRVTLDCGGAA